MGTRSITRINYLGKPLLTFYRQLDGYPSGHGREIAEFMSGCVLINGYNETHSAGKNANGAGCFAAQLIERLKCGDLGGIYIMHHDADDQEYVYTINISSGGDGFNRVDFFESVKCEGHGEADSYDGDLAGFVRFCAKESYSAEPA